MTFKKLLCPLPVVNRAAGDCFNIDATAEKKFNKLNIQLTSSASMRLNPPRSAGVGASDRVSADL